MTVVTINTPGLGSITVGGGGANDPPSGVTSIQIECWGNGASSPTLLAQEGGGASGAYARKNALAVVNGDVLNYAVAAGRVSGDTTSADASGVNKNGIPTCQAQGATTESNLSNPGTVGGSSGDVVFPGLAGAAAQGGGGARGGSGGSSSAGPAGAGAAGSAGSGSAGGAGAASGTDVGGGGAGGASGVAGSAGVTPGGGGGGGGDGANGGTGGNGQVRFTWTAAADTLFGQACL
jgi:hypothetical protein